MKKIVVVVSILALVFISGCVGQSDKPAVDLGVQTSAPETRIISGERMSFVEKRDPSNGYQISHPSGWFVGIEDDSYVEVKDPDGSKNAIVWPIILSGTYSNADAVSVANYLGGQLKKKLPGFILEEIYLSKDRTVVEITASYSDGGEKKKIVFNVITKNGAGFLSAYSAPKDEFLKSEPVLREILSSYKMIQPTTTVQTTEETGGLELISWTDPEGTMSGKIPKGWTVKLGGSCETRGIRVYDPKNPENQVFFYPEFGPFYISDDYREFDRFYRDSGYPVYYADNPVLPEANSRAFVESGFEDLVNVPIIKELFPWISDVNNVRIIDEAQTDQDFASAFDSIGGTSGLYKVEFLESGNKAIGLFTVGTTPPIVAYWVVLVVGISASPEDYLLIKGSLIESVSSITYTDSYLQQCAKVQQQRSEAIRKTFETLQEASDIITSGYNERQETYDRIYEKWSDATLSRDRVYNPDTGEVYSVPNDFYDYYDTNRNQYEIQDLRELQPEEWGLVPLDGELNIR